MKQAGMPCQAGGNISAARAPARRTGPLGDHGENGAWQCPVEPVRGDGHGMLAGRTDPCRVHYIGMSGRTPAKPMDP